MGKKSKSKEQHHHRCLQSQHRHHHPAPQKVQPTTPLITARYKVVEETRPIWFVKQSGVKNLKTIRSYRTINFSPGQVRAPQMRAGIKSFKKRAQRYSELSSDRQQFLDLQFSVQKNPALFNEVHQKNDTSNFTPYRTPRQSVKLMNWWLPLMIKPVLHRLTFDLNYKSGMRSYLQLDPETRSDLDLFASWPQEIMIMVPIYSCRRSKKNHLVVSGELTIT